MPQIYKIIALSILVGTLLGFLIAVSIKYPLSKETYDMAQKTCEKHNGLKTVKVAINGKVYVVICADSVQFKIN